MSVATVRLWFVSGEAVSLFRTDFKPSSAQATLSSIRGKTAGAFRSYGTFQWTSAVQGVAILLLKHALARVEPLSENILVGGHRSLAASLDYAVTKETAWLAEMFGSDVAGNAFAKRLFPRTNPNRKRPGPVIVGVNQRILASTAVQVFLDEREVLDAQEFIALINEIEATSPLGKGVPERALEEVSELPMVVNG